MRRAGRPGPSSSDRDPDVIAAGHARLERPRDDPDPRPAAGPDRVDRRSGSGSRGPAGAGRDRARPAAGRGSTSTSTVDPAPAQVVRLERHDAVDERGDRGRVALGRPLAGEVEQVLRRCAGSGSASSTSRSALWRRSSGRAGSRRMSWLNPRIAASGLLSSWATPGDELADGLHLLGLDELGLQALLLGQVADDRTRIRGSPSSSIRRTSTSSGNV